MKKVLVTGGCGYIGSHTIVDLLNNGFEVISIDNYLNSEESTFAGIEAITGQKVKNYAIDLCDKVATRSVFKEHSDIVGIIHFAALKSVPDSVSQPLCYYQNNLNSLLNILNLQQEFEIPYFIFSSSCSVYGNVTTLPVTETTPWKHAECPYARTKQMGEQIIQDFAVAYPKQQNILLRYFNPAGAHESALIGESPRNKANNLVPIIGEVARGIRSQLTIFGYDYETRDGSCVRDYIHVMDLADAHTKALQYLIEGRNSTNCDVFNVGLGAGATVLEAINAFEKVSGLSLNYVLGERRAGDVEAIYANHDKASELLHWSPTRNIEDIMRTAWAWELKK